jgi:hypothetical protein
VTNLLSMAAIAALVLVEKIVSGHLVSRAVGAGLIVGGWLLMLPMSALGPFADVRCGAHAVPWVDRRLDPAPVFSPRSRHANVRYGSLADIVPSCAMSALPPITDVGRLIQVSILAVRL